MDPIKRRRITLKFKSANPLFEQWLTQWKEEAKREGSKREHTFSRALATLKKCPIPLNSGKDCKILKGFGDRLCQMLDDKLKERDVEVIADKEDEVIVDKIDEAKVIDDNKHKKCEVEVIVIDDDEISDSETVPVNIPVELIPKKPKSRKKTLAKESPTLKKQLSTESAGSSQTKSFLDNMPSTSSEVIEIEKKTGKDSTAKQKIPSKTLKKQTSEESAGSSKTKYEEEFLYFEPGGFDVILYIDTAETAGSNVDIRKDPLLAELSKVPVVPVYEVQHLNVGDFVWICRHRISKKELVLPYIIERKRLDDFAHSIKDGRYHEQKFRLKRCGIQNITYLVEEYNSKHLGLPLKTLLQAATNTAIQDGFQIKITSHLRHTAQYLSNFTYKLNEIFKDKAVMSCPKDNLEGNKISDDLFSLMTFKEFNESSSKNKALTVTDLFVKTLVQIKGMSVEKALALVEVYPLPSLLLKVCSEDPEATPEKLLAQIECGNLKKKMGPALSKIVHQLFTFERV